MTFSNHDLNKKIVYLKTIFISLILLSLQGQLMALLPPIPVPPGAELVGNPLRVTDYIDSLLVLPGSDLSHVLDQLPLDPDNFVEALDRMHPALLQCLTFATDENMQTVRQVFTGRNGFLRNGRCLTFKGLFSDHCNLGPSELWIAPFGVFNDQGHIGNFALHGYRSTTPGLLIGVGSQPNKNTVVGFGAGYSYTDLHWKNKYGNADAHTGYLGFYGTSIYDVFYIDGSFLASYEFYKTKRHVDFYRLEDLLDDFYCEDPPCCDGPLTCCDANNNEQRTLSGRRRLHHEKRHPCRGIVRHPKNRFRGYALLSHVGFGWNFNLCGLQLIPFVSVDYDFVDQDGHREHKARSLNLRVKANHSHLLRSEFGLSATSCIPYQCAWFRPSVTVSFVRKSVLQGERFRSNFVNYPDSSFVARGTRRTLDLVAPGLGLEILTTYQTIFAFNYEAELNKKHITQRATLRFQRNY